MSARLELPASVDAPLLLHGDCLDMLARLPDASVHVVVTDPPAGIGFMGKLWDSFAGYQPRTARGRETMARYGDDLLLAEAANLLLGLSLSTATENLPAREDAARLAAALRERYRSPLARLPAWAVGFVVFMVDVWSEVDRVLKPGGWVCAWALPKTADLAGLAGRAVGWKVHDSLLHLFGGALPKGDNIGKRLDKMAGAEREVVSKRKMSLGGTAYAQDAWTKTVGAQWTERDITAPATEAAQRWDGWNTQLAPGHEQWLLFRKPTPLTFAANVLEHHTGALHVDACRIPRGEGEAGTRCTNRGPDGRCLGHDNAGKTTSGETFHGPDTNPGGSWPRNVLLSTGGEECPAAALDRQAPNAGANGGAAGLYQHRNNATYGLTGETRVLPDIERDKGGASRFFTRFDDRVRYCPKASDRGAGLRSDIVNAHPTHKHVDLMRWLVRLLAATAETTASEPAIVLDPFAGSFTTGVACVAERVLFVGIERDASSFEVGRARVLAAIGSPEAADEANAVAPEGGQLALL